MNPLPSHSKSVPNAAGGISGSSGAPSGWKTANPSVEIHKEPEFTPAQYAALLVEKDLRIAELEKELGNVLDMLDFCGFAAPEEIFTEKVSRTISSARSVLQKP